MNVIWRLSISAINPHSGKNIIMDNENIILLIEIIVALCSDGISSFNEVDWIGYKTEFEKFIIQKNNIEKNILWIPNAILLLILNLSYSLKLILQNLMRI